MNTSELLDIIKRDDGFSLQDWLKDGGDCNSKIKRKSLVEHAVSFKAEHCTNVLLLYGAQCSEDLVKHDLGFVLMVKEIKEGQSLMRDVALNITYFVDDLSNRFLGSRPLNHRDVFSKISKDRNELYCGLHLFEYTAWDFLTKHVKDAFQCGNKKYAKFCCVITVILKDQVKDVSGLGERIVGFLVFREVPYGEEVKLLDEIQKNEDELYIGIHYAETESALWVDKDGYMDVAGRFGASTEKVMADYKPAVTFKTSHSFRDIMNWSHDLNRWVNRFKKIHGVYPNIMLASGETYSRIDMVANARSQDKIRNPEGKSAERFVAMSGFQGKGYALDFCVDDRLDVNAIRLIFDSDPGGDGEPILKQKAG